MMIREEAIRMLKYNSNVIHKTINGETDPNEVKALDMAIKALEQEPSEKVITEIEAQEKWLAEAGYNAYNVGVAFGAIKHMLQK